jgi:hypothetical protein
MGRDTRFTFERDIAAIANEAALDGIYVLRTSLGPEPLDPAGIVKAYKQLATVERAFRSHKTVDLETRPIHHRLGDRVRAHVFLCMLAYHLEWHMRQALKPILFDDHDKADAARASIVAPAQRSTAARATAARKRTDDGLSVHGLPLAARRARYTHPQHHGDGRAARRHLPALPSTHPCTAPRLRAPQRPDTLVASKSPTLVPFRESHQPLASRPISNFGLRARARRRLAPGMPQHAPPNDSVPTSPERNILRHISVVWHE